MEDVMVNVELWCMMDNLNKELGNVKEDGMKEIQPYDTKKYTDLISELITQLERAARYIKSMGETSEELEKNLDESEKRLIEALKPSYCSLSINLKLLKSVSNMGEFENAIANYNNALEPLWGEVHLSCGVGGGRKRRRKSRRRKKKSKRRRRTKKKRRRRK